MAAELGDQLIDVLLDDEEAQPAGVLLGIRAAPQGPPRGEAAGKEQGFQDTVDTTIPRPVAGEDINKCLELSFENTFEPLTETTEGKISTACTRKVADAVPKGVVVRGEEIKAPAKRKRAASSTDDEAPNEDEGQQDEHKSGIGKGTMWNDGKDGYDGKDKDKDSTRKWFVGCYGCGGDHRWSACHAVGPIGQRDKCSRRGKKGHIAKVCAEAASARAAYIKNYGKPWEFEQNLPDEDQRPDPDSSPANKRSRERNQWRHGRSRERARSKRRRSGDRGSSGGQGRSGDRSRIKSRDKRRKSRRGPPKEAQLREEPREEEVTRTRSEAQQDQERQPGTPLRNQRQLPQEAVGAPAGAPMHAPQWHGGLPPPQD